MEQFDVVVIGSGPGGYVAAIRCSQLGLRTAIIERYPTLGGTCLNVGCIPSKAWLDSSEHYYKMTHEFAEHGIKIGKAALDIPQMKNRVDGVVKSNVEGVAFLMKKNKIQVYNGYGSFVDDTTINIKPDSGEEFQIKGNKIIIATGSKPSSLPSISIDKERIITSTEAIKLTEVPKHLILIGGGVIGLELGSVFARLGAKISVVEYMNGIIPTMDKSLGRELQRIMKKMGVDFYTSHKVTEVKRTKNEVTVTATPNNGGEAITLKGDYCLVAVGRRPFTDGLNLDKVGITVDEKGRIATNDHLQTSNSNIYAIGDVVKGAMLAHKAEEEGVVVSEIIAGQKPHINYNLIPGVVYTWPEIASVGQTEEQLKESGIAYKVGNFPMRALGRARASMDIDGFIKVLADKTTDEILGVHMIGARVADLITEACMAMEFRASAEDVGRMSHPHPTYSEAFKEAALAASTGMAINM